MSFNEVIDVAFRSLPDSVRRAPWIGLEHGVVPLDTEQKLDQYLAAYGKMHVEKIRMALDSLDNPDSLLCAPVSIVDWGCGQGLATCCFFDWLCKNEIELARISRIHLIEPSGLALQRAQNNITKYSDEFNCQFDIHPINRYINDIQSTDFDIREINTTLHLFSNILDIENINLDFLSQFMQQNFTGRQVFCCVGPLNNGASRIIDFAGKFGITTEQIEANFKGKLAYSRGTISMLTFIIDDGRSTVRKVVMEPTAPQNIRDNITLQRLLTRYTPSQDLLDRILQFYLMSTELEQLKEPKIENSTPFVMTETAAGLRVSFEENSHGDPSFTAACRNYATACKRNADPQQTRPGWEKDIHFALEVAWDGDAHRLLYATKPLSELGRQFDYDHGAIILPLSDFSVNLSCAESLELTDEKIAEIEIALHSTGISLASLANQITAIIDSTAQLNTTQIYLALCEKQKALVQTYAELKKIDARSIRRNPLLEAFLENAEFENTIEDIPANELISAVPMDKYQRKAIAHALGSRVSVVVGPPGCGKTQLLLNLLANALIRGKNVLVASKNNKAVDNVAERFSKFDENGCFLRFGAKNYLQGTTCPKIAGLLNLSQDQNYDDTSYQKAINQFKDAIDGIRRRSNLEDERDRHNAELRIASQAINELELQLADMQRKRSNILPEFCEKARNFLDDEIQRSNSKKSEQESLIGSLNKKLSEAQNRESQILTNFCNRTRECLGEKLRRWQEQLGEAKQNIDKLGQKIREECNRVRIEIEGHNNHNRGCVALDGIDSHELSELATRFRKMGSDIEYQTIGFCGIWVRMFGKTRLAKLVLDLLADVDGKIRNYLIGIDSRTHINDFQSCREIYEFCRHLADSLDAVISEYREPLALIRKNHNATIGRLKQSIADAEQEVEDIEQCVTKTRRILESDASLEDYTQQEFRNEIAAERQVALRIRNEVEHNITEAQRQLDETIVSIDHTTSTLVDNDRLSDYAQKKYRLPIADRTRIVNAQIGDINSRLQTNEQICDNAKTKIDDINSKLEEIDVLVKYVFSGEFGQKLVTLALNHYLHANDSSRAISAYNHYLPENIPWRDADLRDFITSTERFLNVCRLVAVTSLSVKNAFPRTEGLFDLLVIDEASQCDVASALPLILRAKQVVIIGDPMQLRHISKIDVEEELVIKRHLKLSGATHLKYAEASLWDYARNWLPWCDNDAPCVLENHYRCHPDIIGYSNNMFYRTFAIGGLNVLTPRFNDKPQGIVWVDVQGRQTSDTVNRNEDEARRVVAIAQKIAFELSDVTIGIVTPFKAQAEKINALIPSDLRTRTIVDTVHKFQGDEKDVMIYSLVVTNNSPDSKIRWIDYKVPNLVNVAVTRAKRLLVIVGNRNYIKGHSRRDLPLGGLEAHVSIIEARTRPMQNTDSTPDRILN